MKLTQKLSKQLAVIGSMLVLGTSLFACATETTGADVPQLTQLVMVPEVVNVGASESFQLTVYGRTAAGDSVTPATAAVSWSTSNAAVASVSSQGMVTSGDAGTVTITATSGGATAAAQVTVTGGTPDAHTGWHVATSGSSSGSGSANSPWSLSFALSGAAGRVQPGDTVWLHGGTYRGKFTATVAGAAGRPVVIRQYPGQRATIDVAGSTSSTARGDAFIVKGAWTEWWDFEMMSSDPNRYTDTRPNMIVNSASNTKYIDLVVHDGGIAFYNYPSMSNVEFNGNIIYNNGWQGTAKGGGHALYLKSAIGPVLVQDNISFNQFGYGIHLYTDAGAGALVNMTLDGNVSFNNGSVTTQYSTSSQANILVGGEEPTKSSKVLNNMTYFSPGYGVYNLMIGYADVANVDITLSNNYAVGGNYVLTFGQWDRVTATGNQLIGSSRIVRVKDTTLAGYTWSQNDYKRDPTASAWTYNGTDYSFATWKLNTGLGVTDIVSSLQPSTAQVFVRPSKYEPGRAAIIVYNWGSAGSVNLDLGGTLPAGSRYEVRNVQDWYGAPVTTGTFGGGSISIPMGGVAPPTVVGGAPHTPPRTGPDFDVFVVRLVK
jgi:hypothetical protein